MNELQVSPKSESTNIFEFIKWVLTDLVGKITTLSANMNDMSNQIKTLNTIVSQAPTRLNIMDKLNGVGQDVNKEIDILKRDFTTQSKEHCEKVLERTDDAEEKQQKIMDEMHDSYQIMITIGPKLDEILTEIKKISGLFILVAKIAGIITVIIPGVIGLVHWIESVSPALIKK